MYLCICIYVKIHMYSYMHTYKSMHIHVCMYLYMYEYTRAQLYMYITIGTSLDVLYVRIWGATFVCAYLHVTTYVTWIIHTWHDSFSITHLNVTLLIYTTRLIHMPWLIRMWNGSCIYDKARADLRCNGCLGSFIYNLICAYVTWLFHIWHGSHGIIHSFVTWLVHTWYGSCGPQVQRVFGRVRQIVSAAKREARHAEVRIAKHCNTMQLAATYSGCDRIGSVGRRNRDCNTLQHTAIHFDTLQYTAIHFNQLQYTETDCKTLWLIWLVLKGDEAETATHCNTM